MTSAKTSPENNTVDDLNDAQRAAVNVDNGPVLVVAGAGTGKTRVIVERIARLIRDGVHPESILALTFTEKAAGEMLDRANQATPAGALDATIATFNRFGNDLLQAYGGEWGIGSIRLLGDTGQLVFLREHLDELQLDYFAPVSNPEGQLDLLARYISLLKQQLVLPKDYAEYAAHLPTGDPAEQLEKKKHEELARLFKVYLQLCRQHQVIDYDDQLYLTIEMLQARPNILRSLQERYQYVLVDEFQDTNPMQSALVDMLVGSNQNIMVVGDDDQSIYGWRGATLANILDFTARYQGAQEITLIENYRSTQEILDTAYQLIQHNNPNRLEVMNQLDKRLRAQTSGGATPDVRHFATFDDELSWVAEDIAKRLEAGQPPSSIAVLTRRNQGVQKTHEVLELNGIAHAVAGLSNDLYAQHAVRQLIEGLKAIADPLDDVALFHVLSGPLCRLAISTLSSSAASARREHRSLHDTIQQSDSPESLAALEKVERWRGLANDMSVGSLAYEIITESGWKAELYEQAESDAAIFTEVQALSSFFKTLKEFERVVDVPSVQNYIRNLATLKAAGSGFDDASLDISDTLVNVLSVHRSKGLEWDTVYIVDCTEGSFPLRKFGSGLEIPDGLRTQASQADDHMAEERRLMYVAATRARTELILSYADRHSSSTPRKPSRFLSELFGDYNDNGIAEDTAATSLEQFAPRVVTNLAALPGGMLTAAGRVVLNVSQIDCWLRCPQDFYYKYVLAMPLPPAPALEYGTAIHAIIEKLHRGRRDNQPPTLESLQEYLEANLPKTGFVSARSRDRAHAQAKQTLQTVYDRFSTSELPIEVERSFAVELSDVPLTITGRIDAVYQHGDSVEIRDFKTGTTVATPEKAKSRATGSNQLTLYALAWRELHGDMPALLTLDFVETGQLGSVKKQAKSLDTLQSKLQTMVTHLQNGEYPAGRDHVYCDHPL